MIRHSPHLTLKRVGEVLVATYLLTFCIAAWAEDGSGVPELDKLKALRAEKIQELQDAYHKELVRLKVKYLEEGDLDTALALTDEIAGKTPAAAKSGLAPGPANAEIFANCDDLFTIAVNGTVVMSGGGSTVVKTRIALQPGDTILVRLGNGGQERGFTCVIRRQGEDTIATGDGNWQSYTPQEETDWSNPDKVKGLRKTVPGSNQVWAKSVASESLTPCEAIWGNDEIAYVLYEIPD